MRDEIIEFLNTRGYLEIKEENGAPFPIFYRQKNQKIEAILLVYRQLGEDERNQFQNLIQNLTQILQRKTGKKVLFSSWILLAEAPGEEERALAKRVEAVCFINTQNKKLYIFDELSSNEGVYKQLEAFLDGDIKRLEAEKWKEKKKEAREELGVFLKRLTPVNICLVLSNILIFALLYFLGERGDLIFSDAVLNWQAVFYNKEYYRLFSAMFLHFDIRHLCNNMLFLFLIGNYLEKIVGKFRYFLIYIISGVGAGLASCIFYWYENVNTIAAGASGALFGVVGALLYIIIRNKGKLEEMSLSSFLIMIVGTLAVGFASEDVDNAAHIGGLIVGFLGGAVSSHLPQ